MSEITNTEVSWSAIEVGDTVVFQRKLLRVAGLEDAPFGHLATFEGVERPQEIYGNESVTRVTLSDSVIETSNEPAEQVSDWFRVEYGSYEDHRVLAYFSPDNELLAHRWAATYNEKYPPSAADMWAVVSPIHSSQVVHINPSLNDI